MKCLIALTALMSCAVLAHEVRPAYFELTEIAPNEFHMVWKQPLLGDRRLPLTPTLPDLCTTTFDHADEVRGAALIQRATIECTTGLRGQVVGVDGLSRTLTDVLLMVKLLDGTSMSTVLRPESPYVTVGGATLSIPGYLRFGVEHLLFGFDHILFVIGLMFFVRRLGPLVKTVTAFTIAHSITLGLSALELVQLPQPPVEAVIALSILFLAVEKLRGNNQTITAQHTWIVAFVFGLLHGFGFAGALVDIGLPKDNVLWALFLFNLGVEIGQLLIIAAAMGLIAILSRAKIQTPQWVVNMPLYGMGTVAAYWFIARTVQIL